MVGLKLLTGSYPHSFFYSPLHSLRLCLSMMLGKRHHLLAWLVVLSHKLLLRWSQPEVALIQILKLHYIDSTSFLAGFDKL